MTNYTFGYFKNIRQNCGIFSGEDAETALVESLAMEGAITDANLAGLTTNDLHALSQLSQELTLTADDMETEGKLTT